MMTIGFRGKRGWDLLRLGLALLVLAVAGAVLVPAGSIKHWLLVLGATEYGHWLAVAPLILLLGGRQRPLSLAGTVVAVAALGIFLSPACSAARLGERLPRELAGAFGAVEIEREPFSWRRLVAGDAAPPLVPETLTYSTPGSKPLALDFYRSTSGVPSPCVIVLHTGGWNTGSRQEFVEFNSRLARRGYAVAAVDYRLAPGGVWPAQRDDVAAALVYLKEHAAELGIDGGRFVIMGRSAGGQIAEAAAYSLGDPTIRGCIAFYAPADLEFAYEFGREDDLLKSPQLLRDYLGGTPKEQLENYRSSSAIRFVTPSTPPTLLLHGGRDRLVWALQSERLDRALTEARVPHYFLRLPWATHAFDYNPNGPGGQLAAYAVDHFLAALFDDRRTLKLNAFAIQRSGPPVTNSH